jgi:hypothetical protein
LFVPVAAFRITERSCRPWQLSVAVSISLSAHAGAAPSTSRCEAVKVAAKYCVDATFEESEALQISQHRIAAAITDQHQDLDRRFPLAQLALGFLAAL